MDNRVDINRLLVEMRSIKSQTQPFNRPSNMAAEDVQKTSGIGGVSVNPGVGRAEPTPSFSEMFSQAIDKVNETQKASGALAEAYQKGEPGVDITDVMIAAQKSSVSFQAALQVRNKLVDAYKDIMNMPI